MTDLEQRKVAKEFAERWKGKGYEKGESQKFWIDLLENVLEVKNASTFINFEDTVHIDKATGFIDGFIPSTKVLIEQKSIEKDLRKAIKQSDGSLLNPFQQAKRYSAELPYDDRPRWIVTCNFKSFLVYDMNNPNGEPEEILLKDLSKEYYRLSFLVDSKKDHIKKEEEISFKAGEIVGVLYDAFSKQYNDLSLESSQKSLNELCVRLVFCLYAEDAGLFGRKNVFHDYLSKYEDLDQMRKALIELFKILDTPVNERDQYLEDDLNQFPYVNGGLFSNENIEIPKFTQEIRDTLLAKASDDFDWSDISPTIFGAVFESTLNPETRRAGGMHYTSIENIHKVIDPLFLDELRKELDDALAYKNEKTRNEALDKFQEHIGSLTFFDPACGSGNFLTETYLSLRRMENEAIAAKQHGMIALDFGDVVKVHINQFYGIEINDFAVKVATTALWIAESQMLQETEKLLSRHLKFLPLKTYTNIVEGNALRMDWNEILPNTECNYIMGNPPFVGYKEKTNEQKLDLEQVCVDTNGKTIKNVGSLDYVSGWYYKACQYMINNKNILCGLVSTNSITQGEQVFLMWKPLIDNYSLKIKYAYKTFIWNSEAKDTAKVHCVIIGFTLNDVEDCLLYNDLNLKKCNHINSYLIDAPDVWITSRRNPICKNVKPITLGVHIFDNHNFIFTEDEKNDFIMKEPLSKEYFKEWISASDFLYNKRRYYLDLEKCDPKIISQMPNCLERIKKVMEYRKNNNSSKGTPLENNPFMVKQGWKANCNYIGIPNTSSYRRKYLPIMFFDSNTVMSMPDLALPNGDLFDFGIISSNVHMAWIKTVCGRLKSDYRYANGIVYNNFPWPNISKEQKEKIEYTAQLILEARKEYSNCSLADLYGETMYLYPKLLKAHQENDKAVMDAYGFNWRKMTESECVAKLMEMYQDLVNKEDK